MGVWIEIEKRRKDVCNIASSHPLWVCGLKLCSNLCISCADPSHPLWVCGLKFCKYGQYAIENDGHTLYGCVD